MLLTEFTRDQRSKSRKLLISFWAIIQSVNRCHIIRSTHRMNVQNKSRIFTSLSIICIKMSFQTFKLCKNILRDFATRPSKNNQNLWKRKAAKPNSSKRSTLHHRTSFLLELEHELVLETFVLELISRWTFQCWWKS